MSDNEQYTAKKYPFFTDIFILNNCFTDAYKMS
jgi:hypothetical protein